MQVSVEQNEAISVFWLAQKENQFNELVPLCRCLMPVTMMTTGTLNRKAGR